jgi:hypothetical protein
VSQASTRGLEYTFLIMLVTLAASGVLLLRARRTYATDVASAAASEAAAAGATGATGGDAHGGHRTYGGPGVPGGPGDEEARASSGRWSGS